MARDFNLGFGNGLPSAPNTGGGGGLGGFLSRGAGFLGGMNPLIGASLLTGLGSLFGGGQQRTSARLDNELKEQELNRRRLASSRGSSLFSRGQGMFGKNIFDPRQAISQFQQATAGIRGRNARSINRRLDLDSGTAQGELARINQPMLAQFLLQGLERNAFAKSSRDTGLLDQLSRNFGR